MPSVRLAVWRYRLAFTYSSYNAPTTIYRYILKEAVKRTFRSKAKIISILDYESQTSFFTTQ